MTEIKGNEDKAILSASEEEILSLDSVRFSGLGFLNQRTAGF